MDGGTGGKGKTREEDASYKRVIGGGLERTTLKEPDDGKRMLRTWRCLEKNQVNNVKFEKTQIRIAERTTKRNPGEEYQEGGKSFDEAPSWKAGFGGDERTSEAKTLKRNRGRKI